MLKKIEYNIKSFIFDTQITTHAICFFKLDAEKVVNNASLFLKMQKNIYDYYNLDKLCTVYDVYNIESAVLGQTIKYFKNNLPAVDIKNPLIKNKSDIYKIKNIDFNNNKRCKFVLDLISLYKTEIGNDYKPRFCAPFSLAVNLRGFEKLIYDIYSDKSFIKEFFKIINYEILAPWIIKQRELLRNDAIASGADGWVAIPNVNLNIIEELIIPSYLELNELVGNVYLSLLGGVQYLKNPFKFLEFQKILNPFLVKGLDPDVETLGPEVFRDFALKNNMDLLLGVDANFILKLKVEEVMLRIKKYIDIGSTITKKFTLYFNDIPSNISPGKLKTIFNNIRKLRENLK